MYLATHLSGILYYILQVLKQVDLSFASGAPPHIFLAKNGVARHILAKMQQTIMFLTELCIFCCFL